METQAFIWKMWSRYKDCTPYAATVQKILNFKVDDYFNDHIAFRTIKHETFTKENLAVPFLELGWEIAGNYHFSEKKLDAIHLVHSTNPRLPKIFISELLLDQFTSDLQNILMERFTPYASMSAVESLLKPISAELSYKTYKQLNTESEYASWLYLHGMQANHFTVYINNYDKLTLEQFVKQLQQQGIPLNESGGIIKGQKELGLMQASTIANTIEMTFVDEEKPKKVPTCYVEFAERFPVNGKLFEGFITKSADKIFESTNRSDD